MPKPKPPVYSSFFKVDGAAGESELWFGFYEMNGAILDFWVCRSQWEADRRREDRLLRERYGEQALSAIQWYIEHSIYPKTPEDNGKDGTQCQTLGTTP